jgi:hypothetical protein
MSISAGQALRTAPARWPPTGPSVYVSRASFEYDVAVFGGTGNNDISFTGTNPPGGTPSFGPLGSVLLDGGANGNNQADVDVFGNFPVEVVNATN